MVSIVWKVDNFVNNKIIVFYTYAQLQCSSCIQHISGTTPPAIHEGAFSIVDY